jgi:5'-3' exonuclease
MARSEESAMSKLLAIDGLNIVRRVYEAHPGPDSAEKAQSAIHHAFSSFMKLLATHAPSHVLPAFDYGGRTWRHDVYPRYREARTPMPAPLQERLPELVEMLSKRNVHALSIPGVEADDVIGTGVTRWLTEGKGEAIVASTDKDLHVLIAHGALLWDHFKNEWHDRTWVEAKFGVPPEMLTDLLALVGDSTEGIPGVTKVGIKTAAKLLQSYKTLEGVMAGAGILMTPLGQKLRKDRDQAFMSRQLVKLKTDVRLGITWNGILYHPASP